MTPPETTDLSLYPSIDLDPGRIDLFSDNLAPNPPVLPTATLTSDILTDELAPDPPVLPTASPTSDILPADVSDIEIDVAVHLSKLEEREHQANYNHHQYSTATQEPLESDNVGLEEFIESESVYMGDSNSYIRKLIVDSRLHLLCDNQICSAYSRGKERDLLHLFLHNCFLDNMRIWTNEKMKSKYLPAMIPEFFMAYLGLKIALSLSPQYKLRDYWSSKAFVGIHAIALVMGQDKFTSACANLKHYPEYNDEVASKDPL